jgi:hypothetical protein
MSLETIIEVDENEVALIEPNKSFFVAPIKKNWSWAKGIMHVSIGCVLIALICILIVVAVRNYKAV